MQSAVTDLDVWKREVVALIDTLLSEKIGPPVLQKRLQEAMSGLDGMGHWPRFSALGGGTSNQCLDNGKRVITLTLHDESEALALYERLRDMRPKPPIIIKVDFAESTPQRSSFVSVELTEPQRYMRI